MPYFCAMVFRKSFLFLLLLSLLLSCSVEKKIAMEYMENKEPIKMLIMEPEFCYMINTNPYQIQYLESYPQHKKDSLLYAKSKYVRYLDETLMRVQYLDTLFNNLQDLGFEIYNLDSLLPFLEMKEERYLLNIAQMQLLESQEVMVFSEIFDTLEYFVEYPITKIDFDLWLELSSLNKEDAEMQVFYANKSIQDKLKVRFYKKFLSLDVLYDKEYEALNFQQIVNLPSQSAKEHAQAIFDLFLNQYIDNKLPENRKRKHFYTYDSEKGIILVKRKKILQNYNP